MHGRAVEPVHTFLAALCLAAGLLWPLGVAAQTAVDGAIAGSVLTSAGAAAGGATVTFTALDDDDDPAHRAPATAPPSRTIRAERNGAFLALRLAPGDYLVEASTTSGPLAHASVSVQVGAITDVELRPLSPAPLPPPQPALTSSQLADLPIEAGQWQEAARLSTELNDAPGDPSDSSSTDPSRQPADAPPQPTAGALFSFRGLAPTQNASLLDGVSADQAFRGGARGNSAGGTRAGSTFAQGSVRSFRPGTHTFSAQYGGPGALAAIVSRSGTERLHGGASYTLHQSAWAAANPFSTQTRYNDGTITTALVKPRDSLHIFGGHLGAGTLRGHLYAFAAAEQQWRSFPAISSPSAPAGSPSFYALSPTQLALLGNRGVSSAAIRSALNYIDSLTGELPRTANRGLQFVRLDAHPGRRDVLSLSYARARFTSPAGAAGGPSNAVIARARASVGDSTIHTDALTIRWLRIVSPHITNELRAQFATDLEFETPRPPLAQEPAIAPGGFAPQVSIAGQFTYGTPASLGRNAYPDEQRFQLADVAQWAAGKHLLSAGFDWSRIHDRIDALNNLDGTFQYDSGATNGRAGGLVDWITDYTFSAQAYPNGACPSINASAHFFCFRSFTQSFGQQQVAFVLHHFAGFAQDLWRIRPGLTAELGARYEYTLLPFPQAPNPTLDSIFRASGATSIFPEDRNNLGPRAALAWSPAFGRNPGRWGTLRLGYGMFFGRIPGSRVRAALQNTALPSTARTIHITPTTIAACPQVVNQGFGYPCAYVSTPPPAILATTSASLFAKNFRLPAIQQAELSFERSFGRSLWFRAGYSMALATQLPNTADLNIAPSTTLGRFRLQGGNGLPGVQDAETFVVPLYTSRLSTQFGPVTALASNANATWHGLTVEARLHRGPFHLHAGYTWSKAIDYGPEQGAIPRVDSQFDPFTIGYDKGLSDNNFPQRFAGDLTFRTRLAHGPGLLRKAATGWRISSLATVGSGRGYSYEIFGGDRLSGGAYSINGSGGSAWLPTVGRNTLHLPLRWIVDARLGRGFRITGRLHGEAFAQAFNLTNHLNAARVNARAFVPGDAVAGVTPLIYQSASAVAAEGLTTPAFGTVTSSTTGLSHERQLQMGLRLLF